VLTERLADCCDKVTAFDFSVSAAFQGKQRYAHLAHVAVRCASITDAAAMDFDLLILSEVGYYFSQEHWKEISWALIDRMSPGAVVVAAHWLGHSEDHCISGDQANEVLLTQLSLL
jgi:chemotaxis methyl-accepting protein methylase